MTAPAILFQRVTVVRSRRAVLRDVSFSIAPGEHVAILGHNGAGKSTVVQVISRALYPLALGGHGGVSLFGATAWDLFALRARLGIVSEDLVRECRRPVTVRETVLSGFFGSIGLPDGAPVTGAMALAAEEQMRFMGIDALAQRSLDELSSGEARRAVIARALVHGPSTLVLDEPFVSLDLRAHRQFRETVRAIASRGVGIVLVTHDIGDIVPEISRVLLLKEGRLFRDGPVGAVLTSAVLSQYYGIPVAVERRAGYYHAF